MYQSVMIIDDSNLERYIAEKVIKVASFAAEVKSFNGPPDALAYLESLQQNIPLFPDVIFVDIQMPLMTGFDFLDKFLEFPEEILQHSKIVMLSSTLAEEDYLRMKKYPIIKEFLPKPINEEVIKNLVL